MDQIFGNPEDQANIGGGLNIEMAQPNLVNSMNEPHIQQAQENALDFNFDQQNVVAPESQFYNPQQQQQQQQASEQSDDFDLFQAPSEPIRSQSGQQPQVDAFAGDAGNQGEGAFFGAPPSDPYQNSFIAQPQMDEEQRMQLRAVEEKEQERLMILAERDRQQIRIKQEKRLKAEQDLNQWKIQRVKDIEKRMEINYKSQQNFRELQQSYSSKPNPWEKVVDNVEIKASNYAGSKDVNRLRSSILNKKADFGKLP